MTQVQKPQGKPRKWTPEEEMRAATYGTCFVCGEPRMVYRETFRNNKETITKSGLTCANGHAGW